MFNNSAPSTKGKGQPLFSLVPFISGHLSSVSAMPSPSLSATGQP